MASATRSYAAAAAATPAGPPAAPQVHSVTVEYPKGFNKTDAAALVRQISKVAKIVQIGYAGVNLISFSFSTRDAVLKVLATKLYHGDKELPVKDGQKPKPPPAVRANIYGLPLGFQLDQLRAALTAQVGKVRFISLHYWRDDVDNKPTSILLSSCTAWLEPDSTPVRKIKLGENTVKVVDARLPPAKRRRHRAKKGKKEEVDKGKKAEATVDASASAQPATPAPSTPTKPVHTSSPMSGPSTPSSSSFAEPSQFMVFVTPDQATQRTNEYLKRKLDDTSPFRTGVTPPTKKTDQPVVSQAPAVLLTEPATPELGD